MADKQSGPEQSGIGDHLRGFLQDHPDGWNHEEWLGLLAELAESGADTSDPEGIGAALERERVLTFLEGTGVKGLGPKRREALAERFKTLWNLRHATADDFAELPSFYRSLADTLYDALR